jgi:hypothetical protein
LYQGAASVIITVVRTSPEGGAPMIHTSSMTVTIERGAVFAPAGGCLTDAA